MKHRGRIAGIVAGTLLCLLLIGPFLIPVRPLEGTVPPQELADSITWTRSRCRFW